MEKQPKEPKKPEKETILQNTNEGYVETPLEDVPLSDAAGEGRIGIGRAERRTRGAR